MLRRGDGNGFRPRRRLSCDDLNPGVTGRCLILVRIIKKGALLQRE